ncbi:hypothetical protein JYU34_000935 [Plutella xylostella]|uniref:Uncharacterized protein n=1 Tax=Plutella xylostella TaxID=51655 RepID=A0ABQ7R5T5_PLUXY|nr:hypothetical protein JYU34_000935 [Plutella xylostella]
MSEALVGSQQTKPSKLLPKLNLLPILLVLTPPSSHSYDLENGNTSTETIYQTTSTENIYNNPSTLEWPNTLNREVKPGGNFLYHEKEALDMPKKQTKEFDYSDGVKRRLKKYRKQDGSSEMILNDNDDADINPADLNELHCLKKYRKQDGSSEMILNDNDDADINPADLNELHWYVNVPTYRP